MEQRGNSLVGCMNLGWFCVEDFYLKYKSLLRDFRPWVNIKVESRTDEIENIPTIPWLQFVILKKNERKVLAQIKKKKIRKDSTQRLRSGAPPINFSKYIENILNFNLMKVDVNFLNSIQGYRFCIHKLKNRSSTEMKLKAELLVFFMHIKIIFFLKSNKMLRARATPSQKILIYQSNRMFLLIFLSYIDSCRSLFLSNVTLNVPRSHGSKVVEPQKSLICYDPWRNQVLFCRFRVDVSKASWLSGQRVRPSFSRRGFDSQSLRIFLSFFLRGHVT